MFNSFKNFISKVVSKMFPKTTISNAMDVEIAISDDMSNAISTWSSLYELNCPWLNYGPNANHDESLCFSLGLPVTIAREMARLVTVELESEVTQNDFLNEQYKRVLKQLRKQTEFAAAKGGIVFKPYVDDHRIVVDYVQADNFYPISYNNTGDVTSAVFIEQKNDGNKLYTRLEVHQWEDRAYTVTNKAFMKYTNSFIRNHDDVSLGREISLTSIPEWSELSEEPVTINNIDKPLFAYFKMPFANNVDQTSPLGVSVYGNQSTINLIKQADEMYSRIIWEYEAKEVAIHVDPTALRPDKEGNLKLPKRQQRLYRGLDVQQGDGKELFAEYSPEIRDSAHFNGLNKILQRIEWNVGFSYGTISDPMEVAKTATEIVTSKQRMYSNVKDIQNSLEEALDHLVYAMSIWGQLYGLCNGNYETSYKWDDSIVVDKETELASMLTDVSANILRPEIYLAKKYGVTEEEALKMMPQLEESAMSPYNGLEE